MQRQTSPTRRSFNPTPALPKVSVVITTYNQEDLVLETLESIRSQRYDGELEIIVGDDASSDQTPLVVETFSNRYPGLVVPILRKKNLGFIENYYDLVGRATGQVIMVCAGDDYWLPEKVSCQVAFLLEHPEKDMVYTYATTSSGTRISLPSVQIGNADCSFASLIKVNSIPALTACFRKIAFDTFFAEVSPIDRGWKVEDYPFWLWLSRNDKIGFLPVTTAVYRIAEGSVSRPKRLESALAFARSILDVQEYYLRFHSDPVGVRAEIIDLHARRAVGIAWRFGSGAAMRQYFPRIRKPSLVLWLRYAALRVGYRQNIVSEAKRRLLAWWNATSLLLSGPRRKKRNP